MSDVHPATILTFLINLSGWLCRNRPLRHHRMLESLQLFHTPLLKAIVHAQQIVTDTFVTIDTLDIFGLPGIIQRTLRHYVVDSEENPLERRERLAMNPLITEITIIKLTHALETPGILPSEYRELEREREFWLEKRKPIIEFASHGH